MNTIAIIDLGTNTFNLLIANEKREILYHEKIAVKLGKGGISNGRITDDASERAIAALTIYKQKATEYEVQKILAIATSAIRSAANGLDFAKTVKIRTGIDIEIINGDKEAEYIYLGVRKALDLGPNKSLIIDIGGGSVEFIICDKNQIYWKQSLEIGAQRLLDSFQHNDPITQPELDELNNYLTGKLTEVNNAVILHKPEVLIGSSGTFDTLAEIHGLSVDKWPDFKNHTEYTLGIADFEAIYNLIKTRNRAERMLIPGMIEMRVDMIVVACALISYVLDKFNLNTIRVSTYSLKEGVLEYSFKEYDSN